MQGTRWLAGALTAALGCGSTGATEVKPTPPSKPQPRQPLLDELPVACQNGVACVSQGRARLAMPQPPNAGCPVEVQESMDRTFTLDKNATAKQVEGGWPDACCYAYDIPCPEEHWIEGRLYLDDDGGQVVPDLHPHSGPRWGDALMRAAAAAWRKDAQHEQASVPSFLRAAHELAALGAPAELIGAARAAARDEVRHARACLAMAEGLDGGRVRLGRVERLAPRRLDLVGLAVTTFIESAANETVAALAARRAADGAAPEVATVLRTIARDESRHAALGWHTVRWAVAQGGQAVRRALRLAGTQRVVGVGAFDDDPRWALAGRLSQAARAKVHADAWRELILPLLTPEIACDDQPKVPRTRSRTGLGLGLGLDQINRAELWG